MEESKQSVEIHIYCALIAALMLQARASKHRHSKSPAQKMTFLHLNMDNGISFSYFQYSCVERIPKSDQILMVNTS